MTAVNVTLKLPDDLARDAEKAGLLTPEAIEEMLRDRMRHVRLQGMRRTMETLAASAPALTPDQVEAEIEAARAERNRAHRP